MTAKLIYLTPSTARLGPGGPDNKEGIKVMEAQIQDLVESIRREGLEAAEAKRTEIIDAAKAEADRIVAEAKAKAAKMIQDAQAECALRDQSTRAALSQAARDVSINLKKAIEDEIWSVLSSAARDAMDKDFLSKMVLAAVSGAVDDAEITISGEDAEAAAKAAKAALGAKMKKGVDLKLGASGTGIKIVSKDGSGYIDLSAEECVNLLKPHLSEAVRKTVFA